MKLGKMALAFEWTQSLGIPNILVYFLTDAFIAPLKEALLVIPYFVLLMKLIPRGIESTMQTFSGVIHGLNMHLVRAQIGILINNQFVHVTKENINNYPTLTLIEMVAALIPFIYIYCLIPSINEVEVV